jgi:hypothetical protein
MMVGDGLRIGGNMYYVSPTGFVSVDNDGNIEAVE